MLVGDIVAIHSRVHRLVDIKNKASTIQLHCLSHDLGNVLHSSTVTGQHSGCFITCGGWYCWGSTLLPAPYWRSWNSDWAVAYRDTCISPAAPTEYYATDNNMYRKLCKRTVEDRPAKEQRRQENTTQPHRRNNGNCRSLSGSQPTLRTNNFERKYMHIPALPVPALLLRRFPVMLLIPATLAPPAPPL